jgi:hypothetical protein
MCQKFRLFTIASFRTDSSAPASAPFAASHCGQPCARFRPSVASHLRSAICGHLWPAMRFQPSVASHLRSAICGHLWPAVRGQALACFAWTANLQQPILRPDICGQPRPCFCCGLPRFATSARDQPLPTANTIGQPFAFVRPFSASHLWPFAASGLASHLRPAIFGRPAVCGQPSVAIRGQPSVARHLRPAIRGQPSVASDLWPASSVILRWFATSARGQPLPTANTIGQPFALGPPPFVGSRVRPAVCA